MKSRYRGWACTLGLTLALMQGCGGGEASTGNGHDHGADLGSAGGGSVPVPSAACADCPPPTAHNGWHPLMELRPQVQIQATNTSCSTGGYNTNMSGKAVNGAVVSPDVYAIDLYADSGQCQNYPAGSLNTDAVAALHSQGKKAICYIDIGTVEPYRPDYQDFVAFDEKCSNCLLGKPYDSGDLFLNLNNDKGQRDWLIMKMGERVAKCKQAGFDGVYFDVGWEWMQTNPPTGWNISADTQLIYNTTILNLAHSHNLAAAINYDLPQIPALVPYEDFHVDESCFMYGSPPGAECDSLLPVLQANKPVIEIEYISNQTTVCPKEPNPYNMNSVFKASALLDSPWQACR